MRVPTKRVRELRAEQTEAEKAAWSLLRNRRLGLKFHRQYPIDKYLVDFFCFERRLAIELDGGVHSQPSQIRKDTAKDAYLKGIGIVVLRLPNGLVLKDPGRFIHKIPEAGEVPRRDSL
jgi:very-short-patch-repair endonuclease